ncbi:MAG: Mur ligase family protein [Patescibacteria group bacterium]
MSARYFTAYERLLSFTNLETTWSHTSKQALEVSLTRMRQLLKRLGNPEKRLKYIHVTGTSGKGSVTYLLHEILRKNGESVASYSSPHTTTYLERYRINDKLPHPDKLADAMELVISAHEQHILAGQEPLTFFELNTCTAFLLFKLAQVDWCVLEVGMGGRYDATNVIPSPALAVITNIDLDHTDLLGPTTAHIAREKAGIIKPGCLVITGETEAIPLKIISAEASKTKAPLMVIPNETNDHLEHNADLCRAAAKLLGMSPLATELAIESIQPLPCRLETIQAQPSVILDGAHNAAKIKATVDYIKRTTTKPVHVIFGCKSSKDAKAMATQLSQIAANVTTTRYVNGYGKPENPAKLLNLFPAKLRRGGYLFPQEALAASLKLAAKSDTILITGSLYLAGELRSHWRTEKQILKDRQS